MKGPTEDFSGAGEALPARLQEVLEQLARPAVPASGRADRAVLAQARRRFRGRPPLWWRLRWPAAAAAAVLVVAFALQEPAGVTERRAAADEHAALDVDGDGRVDILDAFAIALQLERRGLAAPPASLDLDGDGVVDGQDVALVARAAVALRGD